MGKRKRNKVTGAVEYEIYNARKDLRKHYKQKHFICKHQGCEDLAFKDQALQANHYAHVHGESIKIVLEFKRDSDSEEELPDDYYQRKKWNAEVAAARAELDATPGEFVESSYDGVSAAELQAGLAQSWVKNNKDYAE